MKSDYQLVEDQNNKKLIDNLIQISVKGLHDMFLPGQLEFALKKKLIDSKIILDGSSSRYTLINLLGLSKAESHNIPINIDLKKILFHQINIAEKYKGIGELGLLLWAAAFISPQDITKILTKVNFNNIFINYKDAKFKLTMELSWFLTGLLMASTFNNIFKKSIGNLPQKVYNELRNNYGGAGIFKHQGNNTMIGKFRGKIASFADQVYPIYAFSLYSQHMRNEEALLIAKECALKICEHQGENGEWAWHYNSINGSIVSKYPEFSVNQIALAPIALYSIQKASGTSFEHYINKGIDWLFKNNNIEKLIDNKKNIIWDGISPKMTNRKVSSIVGFIAEKSYSSNNKREIIKECSSYNYGWILHFLSGRNQKFDKKLENNIESGGNINLLFLN